MSTLKIAKDLFDLLYPVGTYYETSNSNWEPSNAGWYGTWVEDTAGKTTVAKDTGTFKTLGDSVGSETVTLTVNQMPEHGHVVEDGNYQGATQGQRNVLVSDTTGQFSKMTGWGTGNPQFIKNTGGSKPHNNIQPSIVVRRWHRTA